MLEFSATQKQGFTVGKDRFAVRSLATIAPAYEVVGMPVNVLLEGECNTNLVPLYEHIRLDLTEKACSFLICQTPNVLNTMVWSSSLSAGAEVSTELVVKGFNNRPVTHANPGTNVVANVVTFHLLEDVDVALSVKQARNIANFHYTPPGSKRMMANSEKTRCPARKGAEGQPRAKQAVLSQKLPGVCNEHVPSAEAKICSGLHGNMQRLAEMTSPTVTRSVTKSQHQVPALASACTPQHGAAGPGSVLGQPRRHDSADWLGG